MKRTQFSLTESQHSFLSTKAGQMGVSISELLRRIIDNWRTSPSPDSLAGVIATLSNAVEIFGWRGLDDSEDAEHYWALRNCDALRLVRQAIEELRRIQTDAEV